MKYFILPSHIILFIIIIEIFSLSNGQAQSVIADFHAPDSITLPATTTYATGQFKKIVYGNRYRKSWRTPVTMPVFDMNTTFAKLRPVKKGGGASTKSLRLEDGTGREYVLRSIYKNGRAGVPDRFRETVYEDILQDLRVGAHPYGALPIPILAEAAGIYHTNPTIYFLPKQDPLGKYNDHFAGELYLFEEYPNEGWEHLSSFGNTKKIIGYDTMLEKVQASSKHKVDEKWVLRSRLFDMWIGDYDRHDDQWRWAAFPQKNSKTILYRPIPRDRDQAFFAIQGILPWVLSRDFIHIQQRPFKKRIQNTKGFVSSAKHFDRTWLTQLEWADWQTTVATLQANLTDEVIEKAFQKWPAEIYNLNAPKLIKILKGRRENMLVYATELYQLLTKYVNVVGTDKRELFEVDKKSASEIVVKVYDISDEQEQVLFYHRTFQAKDTKEIRLYGLAGKDEFTLLGTGKNPITVRIIGGEGKDKLIPPSPTLSGKKVIVYDTNGGMQLPTQKGIVSKISDKSGINEYNRFEFQYDDYFPLIHFGSTEDDGVFLGGGATFTRYGFRKQPYGSEHRIFFKFSTETDALAFNYSVDFTQAIGRFNFNPNISFDRPLVFNFYGYGNQSSIREDDDYHRVRLKRFKVEPLLRWISKNRHHTTRFGPFFQNVIAVRQEDRITGNSEIFNANDLGNKSFLGLLIKHRFDSVDDLDLDGGWNYTAGLTYYRNLGEGRGYARLEGNLSRFTNLKVPFKMVIGSRIGFATLTDDGYYFFHSNNLGGNSYLRGFRNNRFAGTNMAYLNLDLRVPLFYFKNPVAPGEIGLSAGFDAGRVWYENANKGGWKTGFSPGLWWTPYKFTAINLFFTYTGSGEENTMTLRTGFFF